MVNGWSKEVANQNSEIKIELVAKARRRFQGRQSDSNAKGIPCSKFDIH